VVLRLELGSCDMSPKIWYGMKKNQSLNHNLQEPNLSHYRNIHNLHISFYLFDAFSVRHDCIFLRHAYIYAYEAIVRYILRYILRGIL
jgi:hypothetical protein